MIAPIPEDEAQRLEELRQFRILDTDPEREYDDLILLATEICGTPIALMSLVDAHRQYFKSRIGIDATETPREIAFCAHAILQEDVLVVPNALEDKRFAENPLVTSDPNIRFYAGAPLITPNGHAMGTLCVIDRVPRELDPSQKQALEALGRQVVALLQLRLSRDEAEQASAAKSRMLAQLQAEQEKSERLLLSLFPRAVAERLKNEPPTCIAEEYSDVTMLFARVQNFWAIAGALPPERFIELLNQVFSLFDRLADAHGVQKIKTIGETYMAVCGLPEPDADHARHVAELALSIQREITALETGTDEVFRVQIGIHTGQAIAGVVGISKLAYDLWGPAVNIANKMEESGVVGGIQVSATTHALLEEEFFFEPRGEFYIPGEGEVSTYLLRGRRDG